MQIRSVMTSYCLQLKMVKYWINNISRNIEAVFLKLGTTNVHHKRYYTNIFCVYAYVNMRTYVCIYAHMRMYTHIYVSLLYIPIGFFMWSIVSQTKDIIFLGMKMLQNEICILLKDHANQWKLSYFEFSITSQIHRWTTVY